MHFWRCFRVFSSDYSFGQFFSTQSSREDFKIRRSDYENFIRRVFATEDGDKFLNLLLEFLSYKTNKFDNENDSYKLGYREGLESFVKHLFYIRDQEIKKVKDGK